MLGNVNHSFLGFYDKVENTSSRNPPSINHPIYAKTSLPISFFNIINIIIPRPIN